MPRRYPICIFKCLFSDINYLPKKLLKSWLKSAKSPLPVDVHRASLASIFANLLEQKKAFA